MDAIIPVETTELDNATQNESFRSRSDSITKTQVIDENDFQSADTIEPVVNKTKSDGFNVQHVYEAFVQALRQPDNPQSAIGTQDYIKGYRELLK